MLVESNITVTDDDSIYYGDDEYFQVVHEGPKWWVLAIAGVLIALIAGGAGFVCAMRRNPDFNRTIRNTALFKPLTGSHSQLIRSSLALPQLSQNYDEIENMIKDEGDF